MTNATILKYHQDILSMQGSVMEYWFEGYIKAFYKKFQPRLERLTERLQKLNLEYFQFADGKMLYDNKQQPVLIEGKSIEEYKQKFAAIMSEENNLVMRPV